MRIEPHKIESLFKTHYRALVAYTRKFIQDEAVAADLVQDVFMKLWQSRDDIEVINARAYLFRAVRNASLNHLQHVQVTRNYCDEMKHWLRMEEIRFFESDEISLLEQEQYDRVIKIIDTLPEVYKDVIILRMRNMKVKDIARQQNLSVRTVETHMYRGMKMIRQRMSGLMGATLYILFIVFNE